MARSPIEIMIDNAGLRCTRCRTPQKIGCSCWEKITLRCPECGRGKRTDKEPGDVVIDNVVTLKCPECWDKTES
jgi:hypothetical protein